MLNKIFIIVKNNIKIIIISVLCILFLFQCYRINSLSNNDYKDKYNNLLLNINASKDTITYLKKSNGVIEASISSYVFSIKNMKDSCNKLFKLYTYEKNKPPKTVIEIQTELVEKIVEIPIKVEYDSLNNGLLSFNSYTVFSEGNSRTIVGELKFKTNIYNKKDSLLINDSSIYSRIKTEKLSMEMTHSIILNTGLLYDKKNNKPIIFVNTKYPGLYITELRGAEIEDTESKKALMKSRKKFGMGLNCGYGLLVSNNISKGIYLGIGLSYNPKFLQFGK